MSILRFQSHVFYDDIDADMKLSLKGALRYMQEAAMIHSAQSGYSVADVDRTRVTWMLVQWRVRLLEPVFWNESIEVRTWPRSMERATSIRNFEIYGPAGRLCAVGESNWVLVNMDTGRITRITQDVKDSYDLTERDVFSSPMPEIQAGDGGVSWEGVVGCRDIDTNRHVNNRVYLDYALEAMPETVRGLPFREVSVRYRKQLLPGAKIFCRYSDRNACHTVDICGEDAGIVHGTVVFSE